MSISRSQYNVAIVQARRARDEIELGKRQKERFETLIANQPSFLDTSSLKKQVETQIARIAAAESQLDKAQAVIEVFDSQGTIPSDSDTETQQKYENSEVVAPSTNDQESFVPSDSALGQLGLNTDLPSDSASGQLGIDTDRLSPLNRTMSVPNGAMPVTPKPASVIFKTIAGDVINNDTRVKIRVPRDYYSAPTVSPLKNLKAIIFPYTPSINIESKADYATQSPMHSNFALYFYQRSSIAPINISGKFSVSNENEAKIYIATVHLLRALTKMRSGGLTGDPDSGAPPPVCRLDAYGTFMLQNVPVVISSFKIDLPDNVDYYTIGKGSESGLNQSAIGEIYEKTAVPVISTISISCLPIYSRDEMQKFNVTQWLGEKYVRKAGYL